MTGSVSLGIMDVARVPGSLVLRSEIPGHVGPGFAIFLCSPVIATTPPQRTALATRLKMVDPTRWAVALA